MSETEEAFRDMVVTGTLAESMQNDIDTLDLSGAQEEGQTLQTTYHQTSCAYSRSDGEAECTCLPITLDVDDVRRVGPHVAAEMVEPYLEWGDEGEDGENVEPGPGGEPPGE